VNPQPITAENIPFRSNIDDVDRFVRIGEGHYVLNVPELNTDLEVSRVRRERYDLRGELMVHCGLAGVRTVNGVLCHATISLSNIRDRESIARMLQQRTSSQKIENARWQAVVDELSIRTHTAEQTGSPAVLLHDVPARGPDEWYRVLGFVLPQKHPSMIFGDGDTLKTYTADALSVALVRQRVRVGLVDWEMTAEDHRERVIRLDPTLADQIAYLSCTRPLIDERDRVAQMVHDHQLQFLVFDSVGFGCHDKPEASESAMAYFREVRSVGVGSLHIAHMSKGDGGDQKPFGSAFWFNSVRALWFAKRAEPGSDPALVEIGFFPRKFNLGARQRAFALQFAFSETATTVRTMDVVDAVSLAPNLSIRERIRHVLKAGARTVPDVADHLGEKLETVQRTVHRYSTGRVILFRRLTDGRVELTETWQP
jgi:hypothetical protein